MARILVVEDEAMLRLTYRTILEKAGHKVTEASDGKEALGALKDSAFDLILLDLHMPHMDGLTFLKQADVPKKHPATKVVVFSNLEEAERLTKAYRLGIDRYVLKAATSPQELLALIREVLAGKTSKS